VDPSAISPIGADIDDSAFAIMGIVVVAKIDTVDTVLSMLVRTEWVSLDLSIGMLKLHDEECRDIIFCCSDRLIG